MPLSRCSKCGKCPAGGLKSCSGCHGATGVYCSRECQKAHWKIHKPMCRPIRPDDVWGIKILDNRHEPWSSQFKHVLLNTSHPIFTMGELCPVTEKCGYPLVIYSDTIHGGLPALENNQPAVYLRIEAHGGFAPMRWQLQDPGTCYVVRQDRQPLTKEAIEIIYNFHSYLLSDIANEELAAAGQGPWRKALSPEWLKSFADEYRQDEISQGRQGFDFFP